MTVGFVNFLADAAADPNMGVVAGLGIGTVFAGLVVMVVILTIMNAIFSMIKPKQTAKTETNTTIADSADEKMDDETVAAVSAAIAETLGRDVSGIRITSIKKIN